MFLILLICLIIFKILLYRQVLKFWSNQICGRECTYHTSLNSDKNYSHGWRIFEDTIFFNFYFFFTIENTNEFIRNKKLIGYLIIYWTIFVLLCR